MNVAFSLSLFRSRLFTLINFYCVLNLFVFEIFAPLPHCSLLELLVDTISIFWVGREHIVVDESVIKLEQSTVTSIVVIHGLVIGLVLPVWREFKRVDLGHIKFGHVVYIQLVDSLNVISFYIKVCYTACVTYKSWTASAVVRRCPRIYRHASSGVLSVAHGRSLATRPPLAVRVSEPSA